VQERGAAARMMRLREALVAPERLALAERWAQATTIRD
jgi:hypothetical protein